MTRVEKILAGIAKSDRVAGAYLFIGPPGAGKKAAAEEFAADLKCQKQDLIVIAPTGTTLKIDQIRDLQSWTRFGPTDGKYLLTIVEKADTMSAPAAAAFLKTLEEPAPGVVFVLLAERDYKLPPTILSRCQRIVFPEPDVAWQEDPTKQEYYEQLKVIRKARIPELIKLAVRLEKEKDRIEDLLYDLAHFVRYKMSDAKRARVILDTLRFIKRRANLKLALNNMCLKLGEVNA